MKRLTWEEMTFNQKLAFLEDCAEKAKARFEKQWHKDTIYALNAKISAGYRMTVEEFESYTGIKFSHDMGGKMEEILSISTCCLVNPLCRKRLENKIGICAECFAESLLLAKENITENTCYNYKCLSEIELPDEIIPYIDRKELRIESFGDVGTMIQAVNYIKFAIFNPHCAVTAWTKNPWLYELAFKHLGLNVCPENLTIILSSQYLNKQATIPARFSWFIRKTFTVYTLEYLKNNNIPAAFINCGGRKCKDCQRCYNGAKYSEIHIHELLKKDMKKAEKDGFTWNDGIKAAPAPEIEKNEKLDFSGLFH